MTQIQLYFENHKKIQQFYNRQDRDRLEMQLDRVIVSPQKKQRLGQKVINEHLFPSGVKFDSSLKTQANADVYGGNFASITYNNKTSLLFKSNQQNLTMA